MSLFKKTEDKPNSPVPDARMALALKGNEDVKSNPFPINVNRKHTHQLGKEWTLAGKLKSEGGAHE